MMARLLPPSFTAHLEERETSMIDTRPAYLSIALLVIGCAPAVVSHPETALAPRAVDDSFVCEHLADRFVGLPAVSNAGSAAKRPAPLVGRWWLRACSTTGEKNELRIRLQGPGWYFVDKSDGNLALHQQVPFNLSIELDGRLDVAAGGGVYSVWLRPDKDPRVDLQVSGDLDVKASSAWGSVLRLMPLVPVRALAADRFSASATEALRSRLREGATVTYDLAAGQADATLGRLAVGQTPENAFQDRIPWLVNDRLFLDASGVQVVGPITPGPTRLDVNVERGAGVAYRAMCAGDMDKDYSALARGDVESIPVDPHLANGAVAGLGKHITDFRVDNCSFYLVITALNRTDALVSFRVRA
jgi:hypothetical protein